LNKQYSDNDTGDKHEIKKSCDLTWNHKKFVKYMLYDDPLNIDIN